MQTLKRILTIESNNEQSTRRMLRSIYSADEFDEFEIDHFFFLEEGEESIDKRTLRRRLDAKICLFQPQVILIHTGARFYNHELSFYHTISRLQKKFPTITWGIQDRITPGAMILSILKVDPNLRMLEDLFFKDPR